MLNRQVLDAVEIILPIDDAIADLASYSDYVESRFEESKLALKDDSTPTRFRVKQLTHRQIMHSQDLDGSARSEYLVRCGLLAIRDYAVVTGEEKASLPAVRRKTDPTHGDLVERRWLDEANLGSYVIGSLATAIESISHASAPLS